MSHDLSTSQVPSQSPHTASIAIYNFSHAISCILIGQSSIAPCLEYKVVKDAQGVLKTTPILSNVETNQGLFGVGQSIMVSLYSTRPISSSEFIAEFGKEIGLTREAHAQVSGSGNTILSPVYKLWWVSRNLAYLAMIVAFLFVGFMVMFRQRLNPQTVITVQLALPGLVIGLVMITFSYFISSLLTDVAFLATDLVGYYFQAAQTTPNPQPSLLNNIAGENSLSIMSRMTSAVSDLDIGSAVDSIMSNLSGRALLYVQAAIAFVAYQYGGQLVTGLATPIGAIIGLGTGGLVGAGAGATIGGIIGTLGGGLAATAIATVTPTTAFNYLVSFILVIMMIVTIFKLIFKLINNFLSIIFYTIFSPFTFLISALPGRQGVISDWIKNMLCNVLAFPGVMAVLYFSYFLLSGGEPVTVVNTFGIPDIKAVSVTSGSALPLLGGLNLKVINVLLAFGAFIATPSVPDIICKTIGKIGPAFGMVESQITGSQRSAQGYVNQASSAPGKLSKDGGQLSQFGERKTWTQQGGEWVVHTAEPGLGTKFMGGPKAGKILQSGPPGS